MKKLAFLIPLFLISINTNAQCTGCTVNITTADALNHIIPAGTVFCISPTGSCTGLITVNGGTLCNEGHIGSSNVWVTGPTSVFTNYGTINSSNILVDNGATFTCGGTAHIDSLLVTNPSSHFTSGGLITLIRLAITDSATMITGGFGPITCDYMGDSLGSVFNPGCIVVNKDFYNAYNSMFMNDNGGCLYVGRDWYNSTGSIFNNYSGTTTVVRDWYNSAFMRGAQTCNGIGLGMSIGGISLNSGTIGNVATDSILICDAGHPAGGLDANSGTIIGYLASCYCSITCSGGSCISTGITESSPSNFNLTLSPNPANASISLTFNYPKSEQLKLEVIDMLGKKRSSIPYKTVVGENKTSLDVSFLPAGNFVISINENGEVKNRQIFTVIR